MTFTRLDHLERSIFILPAVDNNQLIIRVSLSLILDILIIQQALLLPYFHTPVPGARN